MKKPNLAVRLISALLCIILCLSLMAGILIAEIRIATTKENTAKIIRETLFSTHTVRPTAVHGAAGHAAVARTTVRMARTRLDESSTGVMTEVLVDWLYESLENQFGDSLTVSQETVEAFIEESTLKDEIADLGASLISDFITGENTTVIDESTVKTLLEENAALIETYFGVTLSQETIDSVAQNVASNDYVSQLQEDGIGGILLGSSSSSETPAPGETNAEGSGDEGASSGTNPVADLLTTFRTATSDSAMYACFGTAALCAIVILLLNLKYIWYALRKIGVTMVIASLPVLIPTLIAMLAVSAWNSFFESMGIVGNVIAMILEITAPLCIGVAAAGVVLVVLSIVLRAVTKRKKAVSEATCELSDALIEAEPAAAEIEAPAEVEEAPDAEEAAEEIDPIPEEI